MWTNGTRKATAISKLLCESCRNFTILSQPNGHKGPPEKSKSLRNRDSYLTCTSAATVTQFFLNIEYRFAISFLAILHTVLPAKGALGPAWRWRIRIFLLGSGVNLVSNVFNFFVFLKKIIGTARGRNMAYDSDCHFFQNLIPSPNFRYFKTEKKNPYHNFLFENQNVSTGHVDSLSRCKDSTCKLDCMSSQSV